MKTPHRILLLSLLLSAVNFITSSAQNVQDTTNLSEIHVVIKRDGTQFVGKILSQDAREVLIETKEMGQVIIPKHEIKEIRQLKETEISPTGQYIPDEVFSTRYFITTNGLPIKKGESYVQWNLFGPDFQFGVGKNFGVGIMTSWLGIPIIGSAKYSLKLDEKVSLGIGTLLGTGSWTRPDFRIALPFAALTLGDRKGNLTFSGGYGAVSYKQDQYNWYGTTSERVNEGRALLSVAFMFKVGKNVSFVFDSFIVPGGKEYMATGYNYGFDPITGNSTSTPYQYKDRRPGFALFIPGIRWQMESNKAFQFGFTGIKADGVWAPVPIPMVQWYRKI